MRIEFQNVRPIRPGFTSTITIEYGADFWAAASLGDGRLIAEFRRSPKAPLLFRADTAAGTIVRSGPRSLTITIPAADTADFVEPDCVFDLIRDEGDATVIPGRWRWPVRLTVTRNDN
jgi:hypothetical protein